MGKQGADQSKATESGADINRYRSAVDVRRRFRVGARWCVARKLWKTAEKVADLDVAKRIQHKLQLDNAPAVTQLRNGRAAFELYVCALASADLNWADLENLPTKRELAYEGYRSAQFSYQTGRNEPTKSDKLVSDTTIRIVLCATASNAYLDQIDKESTANFSDVAWHRIASEVNARLEDVEIDPVSVSKLKDLIEEHKDGLIACRRAIKYRWTKLPEERVEDPHRNEHH